MASAFVILGIVTTIASPDSAAVILARIGPPDIPMHDVVVKQGREGAREAINDAIDQAHKSGGGRVVLGAGVWLSKGPIDFKSDVQLHLRAGCTLRFSTTPSDYLPMVLTRFEGTLLYNYSPLIRGFQLTNVALTGESGSVIDGQGQSGFSRWRAHQTADQEKLRQMGNDTTPHYTRVMASGSNYTCAYHDHVTLPSNFATR